MKKFLPYILIGVVIMAASSPLITVAAGATGGWGAADATTTLVTGETLKAEGMSWANCMPDVFASEGDQNAFDLSKCAAVASYYILYVPTSLILWFGGQVLNGSVNYSLDGNTFKSDMISTGWAISRDVANMFFIFILLYIAIATILQLSGYGMKDLLVKIIIIALLVNFSLLICRVIIDASNILAVEFYNRMTTTGGVVTTTIFGPNARDISAAFMAGFDPQQLLSTEAFGEWETNAGTVTAAVSVLVMFLLGSLMNVVGAFILMAGAVLFVIRIAVLWLIMLLAPLAFLAMVLPATSGYAKQWWEKLFYQAFFAPAFLFLFYLVVAMLYPGKGKTGILKSLFEGLAQNTAGLNPAQAFFVSIITILIHFTIMAVLMIACLIIAKQMGAYGSGTMLKWASTAGKWSRGYAGRVSRGYGRRLTAPVASKLEQGRIVGALASIPGLGGIRTSLQKYVGTEKAAIAKRQEYLSKFSSAELQRRYNRSTRTDQASIAQELAKRGDLGREPGITEGQWGDLQIKGVMKRMQNLGMSISKIEKARPDLAIAIPQPQETQEQATSRAVSSAVRSIKPQDIVNFDREALKNNTVMTEIFNSFRPEHFAQIARTDPRMMNMIQEHFNKNPQIEIKIQQNNPPLYQYFAASPGQGFGWYLPSSSRAQGEERSPEYRKAEEEWGRITKKT